MLTHTEEALPSTIHLPVSSDDTLHFYRYLCTHVLVADEQFLLQIDAPIQDCAQQLNISTKSLTYSYQKEIYQHAMT